MDENTNTEKKEEINNIEKKTVPKSNESFSIKKKHLVVIGIVLLIAVVGVVIGMSFSSKNEVTGAFGKNGIAAEVNNEKITMEYLNTEYEKIPVQQRTFVSRMQLLNQTIINTLLLQEAKKSKIEVSDQDVQDLIDSIQLPEGQTLESIAQMQGFSVQELKNKIKEQLKIQKLLNQTLATDVTDSEIEEYFNNNTDAFKQKLSVNASHILVNNSKEANDIYKQLSKGANFEELAKEKSIDPGTKDNGGNLGVFPKGAMVKEFEDAAFVLKPGEMSKPIKTAYGFHIIKVLERFEEEPANLEKSKEQIKEIIKKDKLGDQAVNYIMKLYDSANIEIYIKEETETNPSPVV